MAEKKPEIGQKKDVPGLLIWGGTFAAVLLILGASFWIAARKQPPALSAAPPVSQGAPAAPVQEKPDISVKSPAEPLSSADSSAAKTLEETARRQAGTGETGGEILSFPAPEKRAGNLRLHVDFMAERDKIPLSHTCFRENVSPALSWSGAPPGTKSYVVVMQKAQADYQGPLNWAVFDIPATAAGLPEKQPKSFFLPDGGKQARNDAGSPGYNGPCESSGVFRYSLRLFALDAALDIPPGAADRQTLIRAMEDHILDEAAQEFSHYYKM